MVKLYSPAILERYEVLVAQGYAPGIKTLELAERQLTQPSQKPVTAPKSGRRTESQPVSQTPSWTARELREWRSAGLIGLSEARMIMGLPPQLPDDGKRTTEPRRTETPDYVRRARSGQTRSGRSHRTGSGRSHRGFWFLRLFTLGHIHMPHVHKSTRRH
jgi:hypothetical protein